MCQAMASRRLIFNILFRKERVLKMEVTFITFIMLHVKGQKSSASLQMLVYHPELSITIYFKVQNLTKLLMMQRTFKGMWFCPSRSSQLPKSTQPSQLVTTNVHFQVVSFPAHIQPFTKI